MLSPDIFRKISTWIGNDGGNYGQLDTIQQQLSPFIALDSGKDTPAPPVGPALVPMVSMLWLSIRITILGLPKGLAMLFMLELQSTMWVSHFFSFHPCKF